MAGSSFYVEVPGEPAGKGRPKFARRGRHVHVYTDDATKAAEARVLKAWEDAGAVRLEGPIRVDVRLIVERRDGHYLKGGDLSAEGRRWPLPTNRKPDVDNALKLALDALNGAAWGDDVQVIGAAVARAWGSPARTEIAAHEVAADTDEGSPRG